MSLFQPDTATRSERHRKIYTGYEITMTAVSFSAAMLFLIGSILFFYPSYQTPAIWAFVVGSALFAISPTLRLVRELHYLTIKD